MDYLVEAKNVTKVFNFRQHTNNAFRDFFLPTNQSFRALDDVSFAIKKNETVGLLGPNGSGKTTLTKCLCGLLQPTEGTILINGKPVEDSLQDIGVALGNSMIYYRLTGYSNLKYFAKLYGVKNYDSRIKELAKFFGIEKYLYNFVETYSLGTKSKLALARAMIHDPEILLLDEPTLGLDPAMSIAIRREIKKMGKTVLLTTHYMEEAQDLCDKIAIIKGGKIIASDTPENLKKIVEKNIVLNLKIEGNTEKLLNELKCQKFVNSITTNHENFRIILDKSAELNKLLLLLTKFNVKKIDEEEPTLQDAFLQIVEAQNEKEIC